MALFWTDSIVICCSNVESAKRWWIETFDCKQAKVPEDWDEHLLSDKALKLPWADPRDRRHTILRSPRPRRKCY